MMLDDDRPRRQWQSEREIEEAWCRLLDSQGIAYRRQVQTSCGVADIVTDDTVYEVKLELNRHSLFKAAGQVTLYAAALRKPRRMIVGYGIDADWYERMRAVVYAAGIFVNGV
jgi:hypothetical protein